MNDSTINQIAVISLERERFVITSMVDGVISTMESRELVQPFGLISFQEDAKDLEVHRDALEGLVQKSGISGQAIGLVIGEDMVHAKRIPVALGLDDSALKDQMEWEAGQLLLSPVKEFRLVYQRLPSQTSSGNPYYLLVLIRKQILHSLRALIESVDLSVQDIEVDTFSILRALQGNYKIENEDIITLLRVQTTGLLFTFIAQGDYFLSHHIDLPKIEDLNTEDLIDVIKKELRRLIFGHRLGQDLGDLNRLFLLGESCTDDLLKKLDADFPVPVEKMNPLKKMTLPASISQSQEILKYPERFAATIGMLLKSNPQIIED